MGTPLFIFDGYFCQMAYSRLAVFFVFFFFFPPLSNLNILLHSLLACNVSAEKSVHSWWGSSPFYVKNCFFLLVLSKFSYFFWQFGYNVSYCGFFCIHFILDPLSFLYLEVHVLPKIWEIFSLYLFEWTLCLFSLCFPFGTLVMCILVFLMVYHTSLKLSSLIFIFFFFLLHWLDNFQWFVFEFVGSVFCLI